MGRAPLTKSRTAIRARQVEARARPLAQQLQVALARLVAREAREAQRDPWAYVGIRKAKPTPEEELRALLLRFGLRQASDSATKTAESLGVTALIPRSIEADALARKPVKIKIFQLLVDSLEEHALNITKETKRLVRDDVRRTLDIALNEPRVPGSAEIARRIARTIFSSTDGKEAYAFSFERANLIARTELVQVENTGINAGMEIAGVKRIEWLAYTDGLSGDRHHERMDGKTIALGDYFTTPLGNRVRYPGDPSAPIEETANCRCTIVPAR